MKNVILSSLTLLLLFTFTFAAAQSIKGAWEYEKVIVNNQDGETVIDEMQPSLLMFMDKHYSIAFVRSTEARELLPEGVNRENMTPEQWKNMGMTYVSNSGVYEISGNKINLMPTIAFFPNYMNGGSVSWEFEVKEKELILYFSGGEGDQAWSRKEILKKVE